MNIRITSTAAEDLLAGHAFYERQQRGIGDYFLDSLHADIDALQLYAGIHPKAYGRLHRALAKRFPFAVYYEIKGQEVIVMAVLDCRQNPASIVARLAEG